MMLRFYEKGQILVWSRNTFVTHNHSFIWGPAEVGSSTGFSVLQDTAVGTAALQKVSGVPFLESCHMGYVVQGRWELQSSSMPKADIAHPHFCWTGFQEVL